ncbi:MAG: hypothetical protein R3Y52_02990 [Psittacicella sp.]
MGLNYTDIKWSLSLVGAAVGVGTLFLPIKAGLLGLWIMIISTIVVVPMIFIVHRVITRFILSNTTHDANIIDSVEAHLGKVYRNIFTILYSIAIWPSIVVYGVVVTNTMQQFLAHQFGYTPLSGIMFLGAPVFRIILSGILVLILTLCMIVPRKYLLNLTSLLVYPLVLVLIGIGIYMIPHWNLSSAHKTITLSEIPSGLWSSLPMFIFAFTFVSPLSQFSLFQRARYKERVVKKTDKIILLTVILVSAIILFFTYSIVLGLTPHNLIVARGENATILTYLANVTDSKFLQYLGPIIALLAIATSYFAVFQGAREGASGIIHQYTPIKNKSTSFKISTIFLLFLAWLGGIYNPSITHIIGLFSGPSFVLFAIITPLYAMYKVKAVRELRVSTPAILLLIICGLLLLINAGDSLYNNLLINLF